MSHPDSDHPFTAAYAAGTLASVTPCENPEAHEAHMRANGECPWCYAFDLSQIDEDLVICEAHGNPDCGICS